ncbi:MAG TPA: ImmA/IrrE family metallo-endopeptidase [Candidatus Saccharimonadales bacterium]|nr:ImmA/IrrE family metallo-endopeptidase [Candidatus Saccharimonadales bacterium]
MQRQKIQILANAILNEHNLNAVPVKVEKLAKLIGAEVKRDNLKSSLSGFAVQKHGSKFIGINSNESAERQRFTIAHEIGHLFLHKKDSVNYDLDGAMLFRDGHSKQGTDVKEIEANRFAAELLMPEVGLRQRLAAAGVVDLVGEDVKTSKLISKLAKEYQVSTQAMSIRLTTLYFS